jgi:hypothetical protein
MLRWVKEGNDRPNPDTTTQNDVPDEVITEKRANAGARSIDPDGERSEHMEQIKSRENPYTQSREKKPRAYGEDRAWLEDDERPESYWTNHRYNLKQQFEKEVDEYGTSVKDHHTEKMVVTPGMAQQYLMEFAGVTELVMRDLEQLHFYDPTVTFQVIQPMHKMAVANWRVQSQFGMSIGPDHARLLDKIATFPILNSTKQRDVLAWLKQLPNLLAGYKILIMPFDHVELRFESIGLCIPGVGTEKFGMMGSALAMVLDKIISNQIDRQILNLLAIVKNKVLSNGYNVLHKLLTETVECFNPNSIMIEYPHYSDYEDIYSFAEDFDSFVAMKRRKGELSRTRQQLCPSLR